MRHTKLLAIPALIAGFSATTAQAYTPIWSVSGQYTEIVVADCSNCDEDTGILIACTGNGKPAKVIVSGAASERGRDGDSSRIHFDIDGIRYSKQARTVHYGLIGYTPEFELPVNDPLIFALQSGNHALISFNGSVSTLSLRGSGVALETFKAHCGWTRAGFLQNQQRTGSDVVLNNSNPPDNDQKPVEKKPPIDSDPKIFGIGPNEAHSKPNANGELWFTGTIESDTGNQYTLTYGIPETDAISFRAVCDFNSTNPYPISLAADIRDKQDGDSADVDFTLDGNRLIKSGTVYRGGEEFAGVNVKIEPFDLVWDQLTKAKSVKFGILGHQQTILPGSPETVKSFLGRCLPE